MTIILGVPHSTIFVIVPCLFILTGLVVGTLYTMFCAHASMKFQTTRKSQVHAHVHSPYSSAHTRNNAVHSALVCHLMSEWSYFTDVCISQWTCGGGGQVVSTWSQSRPTDCGRTIMTIILGVPHSTIFVIVPCLFILTGLVVGTVHTMFCAHASMKFQTTRKSQVHAHVHSPYSSAHTRNNAVHSALVCHLMSEWSYFTDGSISLWTCGGGGQVVTTWSQSRPAG